MNQNNIVGVPNTNETRAIELNDCDTSFEAGFKMITLPQMQKCYDYGVFQNSFSEPKSRIMEDGKISLTDFYREIGR